MAILMFLAGIVLVLGGLGALVGSAFVDLFGFGRFAGLVAVVGVAAFILGILTLIEGWGMWSGREWAWIVGIILTILGLLSSIAQLAGGSPGSVLGIIIYAIILYYLTRPHIRTYFKGQPTQPVMQPAPTTT
jgi:hypothetical protein